MLYSCISRLLKLHDSAVHVNVIQSLLMLSNSKLSMLLKNLYLCAILINPVMHAIEPSHSLFNCEPRRIYLNTRCRPIMYKPEQHCGLVIDHAI